MNVSLTKNGNVSGVITLTIEEADYKQKVKKLLAELGQRPMKGFRPGHVPAGLLNKMFGKQALAEAINNIVGEELSKFIQTEKLPVLGEPMINEDTKVDFENDKTFTFKFDVALRPEIALDLAKVKIPYYEIEVSDEMVENQDKGFRLRFGKQGENDEVTEEAFVKGELVELDETGEAKAEGIVMKNGSFMPKYMKNDEGNKLVGMKKGDAVVINVAKAADGNATEISSVLGIDKEAAAEVKSDFKFTIESILVTKPAELGQEFYDMVYGAGTVSTEEEYKAKVREGIAQQLMGDSNYRFTLDAQEAIVKVVGEVELADELLKRYFKSTEEDAEKAAKIETDYPNMRPHLVWQLAKDMIAEEGQVKIEEQDLKNIAKLVVSQHFTQYGIFNAPEDLLDGRAEELLKDKNYRRDFAQRAMDDKMFAYIRTAAKVDVKKVSVDEFNKLFDAEK